MCKHAYTFRLYPTRKQAHALQERKDAYRMASKHIHYYDQASQLPDIKDIRQEYQDIHSQVLQDVLRRVDKTFKAFFVRCKRGVTPGYPRFKGRDRYDSFTYPQGGYSLTALNILRLGRSQRGATRVEAPCL